MFRRMIGMSPSDWRREQLVDRTDEEQPRIPRIGIETPTDISIRPP
jgi:hypothetical protein